MCVYKSLLLRGQTQSTFTRLLNFHPTFKEVADRRRDHAGRQHQVPLPECPSYKCRTETGPVGESQIPCNKAFKQRFPLFDFAAVQFSVGEHLVKSELRDPLPKKLRGN